MIAMVTVGGILTFRLCGIRKVVGTIPLMPPRVLNRTFLGAICIDVLYMLSGNMRSLYYSSWTWVVKDWYV